MKKNKKTDLSSTLSEIKKFYEFMTSSKLEVMEFSQGETYIKLARKPAVQAVQHPVPVFTNIPATSGTLSHQTGKQAAQQQSPQGETLKSPMSGIFYRAPTPSSPPYVREGDLVKTGQVLFIVEAMKVFNEIKADFDFKVTKVLAENGKAINVNQDVFIIERQ